MFLPIALLVAALVLLIVAVKVVTGLLFLLVPWVILGLVAGWVASKIVGSPYGLGGDVLVGIAGSVIGGAIFSLFHVQTGNVLSLSHVLVSIIGAVVLLVAMRAVRRPAYRL
ncbi:MAG TPA: GlsB/YeaQ/YmgE family stress response membrane protein [Chloroflexota bacterium]|nr:GlsB/YeaQ/YmgE family stress response membrane protein [Chloroflexota bacterium]